MPVSGRISITHGSYSAAVNSPATGLLMLSPSDWYESTPLFTSHRLLYFFFQPGRKLDKSERMLIESQVQSTVVAYAKRHGLLAHKYMSTSVRSVPDYQFTHQHNGRQFYIEFKRPGEEPSTKQWRKINEALARGVHVYVCDCKDQGRNIIDAEIELHDRYYAEA